MSGISKSYSKVKLISIIPIAQIEIKVHFKVLLVRTYQSVEIIKFGFCPA